MRAFDVQEIDPRLVVARHEATQRQQSHTVWMYSDLVARKLSDCRALEFILRQVENDVRLVRQMRKRRLADAYWGAAAVLREAYREERAWLGRVREVEPDELWQAVRALLTARPDW